MTSVSSEIVNMQSATAINQSKSNTRKTSDVNDSNMFLTLMLKQLENQDPTAPTDNAQWLSQLAQYSSLEQMTSMNSNFKDCMNYLSNIYSDLTANAEITQTLSMIGKEVTLQDPENEENKITGKVSEVSFESGTGEVKVGDKYYSIANILSVKDDI